MYIKLNIIIFLLIILIVILYICKRYFYIKESFDINPIAPNIIQTWKNNIIPEKYKIFVKKIKKLNPKSKYMFFNDDDIEHFIKNKFPKYYNIFNKFPYKIQKIDFFRYLAIYYYGGVYLDLDIFLSKSLLNIGLENKCVFPLEYINNSDILLQKQGFKGLIGNYAFYSPKGHSFIKKIIDNIVNNRIKTIDYKNGFDYQRYVLYKTGPVMVTQSYIDYRNKNFINLIKPYPFEKFCFGDYGKHQMMGTWKNNIEKFSNFENKIGIVISCFNRPDYLSRTLKSISKSNMSNTILCIIDDHSSNTKIWKLISKFKIYNQNCKIIKIRNEKNLGIRYSLKKGWDLLYPMCEYLCNIDSDVIVKKNWLNKLKNTEKNSKKILNTSKVIVSGFNCIESCNHPIKKIYPTFYKKETVGGINLFFNKNTYQDVLSPVLVSGNQNLFWDWEVCKKAKIKNCPILVTKPSVIQHIGIKGLNSGKSKKVRYDIAEDF